MAVRECRIGLKGRASNCRCVMLYLKRNSCVSLPSEEGPHYVNAHLGEKSYWPWEDKAVRLHLHAARYAPELTIVISGVQ